MKPGLIWNENEHFYINLDGNKTYFKSCKYTKVDFDSGNYEFECYYNGEIQ